MAQCRELASELDEQAKLELSQLRKDVPLGPDGKPLQLGDYNLFDDDSFDKDGLARNLLYYFNCLTVHGGELNHFV